MSLWDWLLPYWGNEASAPTGGRKRTTGDPREAVLHGANHGDVVTICDGCNRRAHRCSCEVQR